MRARLLAVFLAAPLLAVLLTLVLGLGVVDALPALVLLTAVWALFLVQLASGRTGRAFLAYTHLRSRTVAGRQPARRGERRTIAPARRVNAPDGRPRLAWSHDGWAHADGHLVGLELLAREFDIVAFGCENRWRGVPPVELELLPEVPNGPAIRLEGLERHLGDFDVVWCGGSYEGTTWQALEARRDNGPAVVSLEVENLVGNYGGPGHPLRARSAREVDHFCATTTTAASILMLDGVESERISLVPMVVNAPVLTDARRAELRAKARARFGLGQDDVVALFLGRAVWEKGLQPLAGALAWLHHLGSVPSLRLLIAGDGDELARFRTLLEHYGALDAVRFAGALAPEERDLALAAADFQVVPSMPMPGWVEQFGRVIPEGFHFGLPVIGSASGSIPEVVGDAGVIVAPGDHGALAGALVRLADGPERAELTERAWRRGRKMYSVEAFVDRMAAALHRGIHHRRKASG